MREPEIERLFGIARPPRVGAITASTCSYPAHSPITAYGWGCRCDRCRAAMSAWMHQYRGGPDPRRTMTLPERVRARIRIDDNGCWIWPGARNQWDYGMILNRPGQRPLALGVHRVMYEEAHGPIPHGKVIVHRCGVRLCCNPEHLALARRHGRARGVVIEGESISPEGP